MLSPLALFLLRSLRRSGNHHAFRTLELCLHDLPGPLLPVSLLHWFADRNELLQRKTRKNMRLQSSMFSNMFSSMRRFHSRILLPVDVLCSMLQLHPDVC